MFIVRILPRHRQAVHRALVQFPVLGLQLLDVDLLHLVLIIVVGDNSFLAQSNGLVGCFDAPFDGSVLVLRLDFVFGSPDRLLAHRIPLLLVGVLFVQVGWIVSDDVLPHFECQSPNQ